MPLHPCRSNLGRSNLGRSNLGRSNLGRSNLGHWGLRETMALPDRRDTRGSPGAPRRLPVEHVWGGPLIVFPGKAVGHAPPAQMQRVCHNGDMTDGVLRGAPARMAW